MSHRVDSPLQRHEPFLIELSQSQLDEMLQAFRGRLQGHELLRVLRDVQEWARSALAESSEPEDAVEHVVEQLWRNAALNATAGHSPFDLFGGTPYRALLIYLVGCLVREALKAGAAGAAPSLRLLGPTAAPDLENVP